MCPFCLSTIGLVVAGAVSTGGLAALAAMSRKEQNGNKSTLNSSERSSSNERTSQDTDQNSR